MSKSKHKRTKVPHKSMDNNCELWCYLQVPPAFQIKLTYMMDGQAIIMDEYQRVNR